jgi:hypothetical protein
VIAELGEYHPRYPDTFEKKNFFLFGIWDHVTASCSSMFKNWNIFLFGF